MICVGIDAAAFKHDVCIYDTSSAKVVRRMRIENNAEDYESLLRAIKATAAKENAEVRLGVESTGSYSRAIVEWFAREEWIKVYHANPILTSTYQQCSKVHYAKNDRIDAEESPNSSPRGPAWPHTRRYHTAKSRRGKPTARSCTSATTSPTRATGSAR